MDNSYDEAGQQFFGNIALIGPTLFYESAFEKDELAARFEKPTPDTARDFVVLRTLAEVQKYGVSARRSEAVKKKFRPGDRYDALEAESVLLETVTWQRRLLEALVMLINFSVTQENVYFSHFLALHELERRRRLISDEVDFFGSESELTKLNIAKLKRDVDAARARLPEPANCWYLKPGEQYRVASLRSQYVAALKLANASEKTALGYTYRLSFGAASELLHFHVTDVGGTSEPARAADALCGLLALAIIGRAHEVCGVEPLGINKIIVNRASQRRMVEFLAPAAETGDFVLTEGPHIAQICDVRTTEFGYASYRVKFLDSETGPGVAEDWLPVLAVRMFMTRQEMIDGVKRLFAEHSDPDSFNYTDEEVAAASREAVVKAWKLGLREYFRRQIEVQAKRADSSSYGAAADGDATGSPDDKERD